MVAQTFLEFHLVCVSVWFYTPWGIKPHPASLCYLDAKISEHGRLLQSVFPDLKLKPKHHFLGHYPHLIRCFRTAVDFWTFRFEAKHSFFKKVVRDVNNFKNILMTLSLRHELMVAYYLDMQLN